MNIFNNWNTLKQQLSEREATTFCNKREIWWCSIGMNIGTELYGKNDLFERPVLVLKVYNKETIFVLPLTSKVKEGKYHVEVPLGGVTSCAVLSQGKTISTKRLSRKVGRVSKNDFRNIYNKYIQSL